MNKINDLKEIEELKLTAKDRQILRELFDDARKPYSEIAKKVKLSKEAVAYRIQRLEGKKLIVGYNTIVNVKKLGWDMFFVYIKLKQIDTETENNIINYLKEHQNVAQIFKTIGTFDIVIKLFVKDYNEVNHVMKEIEAQFQQFVDSYNIDYLSEEHAVPFSFYFQQEQGTLHILKEDKETVNLKKIDYDILKQVAKNARIPITDIAKKINQTRDLTKYHFKKLKQDNIIVKYRPDTIPKILGYNWYWLTLTTGKTPDQLKKAIETYLLNHPNVTYFYNSVGSSDIQVELRVKTTIKLNEILMEIRSLLKSVLKRHELLLILDEPKYTYVPECVVNQ